MPFESKEIGLLCPCGFLCLQPQCCSERALWILRLHRKRLRQRPQMQGIPTTLPLQSATRQVRTHSSRWLDCTRLRWVDTVLAQTRSTPLPSLLQAHRKLKVRTSAERLDGTLRLAIWC